jgi:hypothetical protein
MNDLDILNQIGKTINVQIKESDKPTDYGNTGYNHDKNGHVIGLSLVRCDLKDLNGIAFLLKQLPYLQEMNFSDNQLTDISPLKDFNKLTTLILRSNEIGDISPIKALSQIRHLDLFANNVTDIAPIAELKQIERLNLHDNPVSNIFILGNLKSLKKFYFSRGNLNNITFIKSHRFLTTLVIDDNKVSDISALKELKHLRRLTLSNNLIHDISPFKDLKKLDYLDLKGNPITKLPEWIVDFDMEISWDYIGKVSRSINLFNNPIEIPPIEIVKQGKKAIKNYFKELGEQGEEIVYEAKLIIMGDAGVGKSSLARKIINTKAPCLDKKDTTIGIDLISYTFPGKGSHPDYKLNIWDLGGQDVYLSIHQLFFSRRCLYVLIDDGRKENKLESFWIPAQELLGGDSPILILHNKHGDLQPYISFNILKSRYENIKGELWSFDICKDFAAIDRLREQIRNQFINLPQFVKGEKLPKNWVKIKKEVEAIDKNYVYLSQLKEIFIRNGFTDPTKQNFILDYLHDLGIILRFNDSDNPLLNKFVILKPQWALDAIYKVLKHTRENTNRGVFTHNELLEIWIDNQYQDTTDELLGLMKKFELCYPLTSNKYLVPALLPSDIPIDQIWDSSGTTIVKYEYDFMPRGIISRLIVRLNHNLDTSYAMWRDGAVFQFEGNKALACNIANKRIEISAKGRRPSSIISIISREIEAINNDFVFSNKLKLTKKVPCICNTCKKVVEPTYYDYEDLIRRQGLKKKTIECKTPPNYEEVMVDLLLENVDVEKKVLTDKKTLRTFISYSKFDGEETNDGTNYLEEFKATLTPLTEYDNLISTWDDTLLIAGEQWDDRIKTELSSADIIFILVSNNLLRTKYIKNTELKMAFERQEKGECLVVPIIIRDCGWTDIPWLSKNGGIPRKGNTISSWKEKFNSKDQAWKHVYDEVKKLIENFSGQVK